MNASLLSVPDYEVDMRWVSNELKEPIKILAIKFIKVILNQNGNAEKIQFSNLKSLVDCADEFESTYYMLDVEFSNKPSVFRFINIDKIKREIKFYRDYNPLPNKWEIFFNAKDNIVVHDPLFPKQTNHRYLRNNKYYNDVDFHVGISSLVEVIKNTASNSFEEIIPVLNSERERLKNIVFIDSTANIPTASFIKEEKDYFKQLIGLENVKNEISALRSLALIRGKKIRRNIPVSPTTLHMVFQGNPGTGKTTVARLVGQIYSELGLLKSGHLVEVTSGDLEAKYVGQTAPQTKEYFEKAIDGVLFIDEAYSLMKSGNNFGKEVIETLLKLMEDNRERIVVILAGYPSEMEKLLKANPGFRDRFSTFLYFDDYTKAELNELLLQMVSDMKHKLSKGARYKFECLMDECYDKGYFKSNGRSIRNIFEIMQKRQSLRLSKLNNPCDEDLVTFIESDLPDLLN